MTNTTTTPPQGPRTYQCLWRWDEEGRSVLQTAEEWLDEEADVDDALGAVDAAAGDADDDSGRRAGILRAIAREIATLRRDVALWSAAATAKEQELQRLRVEADA